MTEIENYLPWFHGEWAWAAQVFVVILVSGFLSFFLKRLLARILAGANRTGTH